MYKMAQFDDQFIIDDEINQIEEVSSLVDLKVDCKKSLIVPQTICRCDSFESCIELPCLAGVSKGIWRQVSYTIYRQVEEKSEYDTHADQLEQPAEAGESSDDEQVENVEEIIEQMK